MSYTVKQLASFSGVSSRTLRFYDEIGLLKPEYYGENNYRYYGEEQLLMLQQILFFRELGFPLSEIQRIISCDDFNKIEALKSHKKILKKNLDETQKLIKTVDKTIAHLRGEIKMKNEEFYYGFDSEKQKQYEEDLVKKGIISQEVMNKCKEKTKKWSEEDRADFLKEGEEINKAFVTAIQKQLRPSSKEVQALVRRHYAWIERSWMPTKESYIGLSQMYQTPEFKKFYDHHHPKLLEFIVAAMKVFAEAELK
ncbi:MerR family transcriptional regulator [Legionella sp.]|uniref:MerR family transcriptional regulator n=1 Tax=Legionella sp. TaxID=459 RepID=UPI0032203D95